MSSSHPDYTSDYVYFNVSLNGQHLFRTDPTVMGFDTIRAGTTVREELVKRFPASEGFAISRHMTLNSGTSQKLEN